MNVQRVWTPETHRHAHITYERPFLMFFNNSMKNDLILLPRDAMRKRGLCCGPVSVRPSVRLSVCLYVCLSVSVCLSRLCILSRRLKISSNFFIDPGAPLF